MRKVVRAEPEQRSMTFRDFVFFIASTSLGITGWKGLNLDSKNAIISVKKFLHTRGNQARSWNSKRCLLFMRIASFPEIFQAAKDLSSNAAERRVDRLFALAMGA
jgi:hypothetical protein